MYIHVSIKLIMTVFSVIFLFISLAFRLSTVSYAQEKDVETVLNSTVQILVDDFIPQPLKNESEFHFNRLEGNRGAAGQTQLDWGNGIVTATILSGTWGGLWMSLNHPSDETISLKFSAILPEQIRLKYQSKIKAITVKIASATPGRTLKLEFKDPQGNLKKEFKSVLDGGAQVLKVDLTEDLSNLTQISQLVIFVDNATAGDYFALKQIAFTATNPINDPTLAGFVWSYGMLLNNWNPDTGLVRDKSRDKSGEFDAVQATGGLAAATAIAYQLGIVSRDNAIEIVNKISNALLVHLPRYKGLWPHWVYGPNMNIVPGTEWSSVDTTIAALGLLEAQTIFDLDTSTTEAILKSVQWKNLIKPEGISHGYDDGGKLLGYSWDTFGGESWLVELAYVMGSHKTPTPLKYPLPPTANGSGFIDELAWLFLPPPKSADYWGADWATWRNTAVHDQLSYYPNKYPFSCFTTLHLFGLSASDVPTPWTVDTDKNTIYQSFGIGGQHTSGPNDGFQLLGAPVVVPHYSAMIASLRPQKAISMWMWLINKGHFSPLNNVESLMFTGDSNCGTKNLAWNHLKGSWNLALQSLGWGRYLAKKRGQVPILWQAVEKNLLLREGYETMTTEMQ